jgi:flavin reductase (DIM6/NTAB) family NADH-FMN oxidoreductase RutF
MLTITPGTISTAELQGYLQGAVAPRPIALASTLDAYGNPNLSPFSFFNLFSSNPPIVVFSPARRARNNTTKDTLENILATREVVINVVTFSMVEQTSLASTEYPTGINEFVKAGFTPVASEVVKPFRVAESPIQLECKVNEVIALGQEGGAGNLVICEILKMHISEEVINDQGKIDPFRMDLVARLGGDWYCRANFDALFEVAKPLQKLGIGVDALPKPIRTSHFLTGNDLGKLGNVEKMPETAEVDAFKSHPEVAAIFHGSADGLEVREKLHQLAHAFLEEGRVEDAWKTLLCDRLNRN